MNQVVPILQVVGTLVGSLLISFLAILKFKNELKKEHDKHESEVKQHEMHGIKELFEVNAKFRDEVRLDNAKMKDSVEKKTAEAEESWKRLRECEASRIKQDREIATMRIELYNTQCEFAEFKKVCETKHKVAQ